MIKNRQLRCAAYKYCFLKAGFLATLNYTQLANFVQETRTTPLTNAIMAILLILTDTVVAQTPLTPTVVTSGSSSADLVASAIEAYVMYPSDNWWQTAQQERKNLINFQYSTVAQIQRPYPSTDPFEKCWWVRWDQPVQIRSFSGILGSNSNHVNVYVTSTFPFSIGDYRLICQKNVWPDGAFNCGHTLIGTYFVMMILDTNEGEFQMNELRFFSTKDLAVSASAAGAVQNIVGTTLPIGRDTFHAKGAFPFYIDLGAAYPLSLIWLLIGSDNTTTNVSIGTTQPANNQAFLTSWQRSPNQNEEWNMGITNNASAQYVLFCKSQSDCAGGDVDIRKVQVLGTQTCNSSQIMVSLTSIYMQIAWTGTSIQITWPNFSISPPDCFGIVDIQFTDQSGTDLVASGLFAVDRVTKTLTYNSQLGCVDSVTMYTNFNTIAPFYKDSGNEIKFECSAYLCSLSTIASQSFSTPQPYQIIFSSSNAVKILDFAMHTDSEGISRQNPIACGYKTYTTNQLWLYISIINGSDYQLQLIADTNNLNYVGTHQVILTIGFQNPLFKQTIQQTLAVVVLHPCKKTVMTSQQVILEKAYTFGTQALLSPFSAFEDSVSNEYQIPELCQLTYSISTLADAARFGVTIETSPSLQIKVHTLDHLLVGQTVTLSLYANATPQQETPSPQLKFQVIVKDPCPNTVISQSFIAEMNYTVTKSAAQQQFTLFSDSISIQTNIPGLCGPIEYFISEAYQFVSVAIDSSIGIITVQTNLIQDAQTHIATLSAKLSKYPDVALSEAQFTITIINPCLSTTLTFTTTLQPVRVLIQSVVENLQTFGPATDQASQDALNISLWWTKNLRDC